MAERCVIGVDGGGTKTACLVAAVDGTVLARAEGGPSNYQSVGAAATRAVLEAVVLDAARQVGHDLDVAAVCLALAGVDRPDDRRAVEAVAAGMLARPLGPIRWRLAVSQVVIVNDAVAALVGGCGRKVGVVAVAGTGSIAFGRNARGEHARAGGWGYLLGDEGSGYAIGLAALRAVCRAADGRGPPTTLAELVLAAYHLAQPSDLIARAYGDWQVPEVAALAPLVARAADQGDALAGDILAVAADELALAATTVVRRLGMAGGALDVVTAGGVWPGVPRVRERFAARVRAAAPRANVLLPRADPAAGAVLLARESIGAATLA